MSDPRHELARDVGMALAKASPGGAAFSLTWNGLVAIATIAYLALQAAYLIWKWRREGRAKLAAAGPTPVTRQPQDE